MDDTGVWIAGLFSQKYSQCLFQSSAEGNKYEHIDVFSDISPMLKKTNIKAQKAQNRCPLCYFFTTLNGCFDSQNIK